jgi:hypothetical protein
MMLWYNLKLIILFLYRKQFIQFFIIIMLIGVLIDVYPVFSGAAFFSLYLEYFIPCVALSLYLLFERRSFFLLSKLMLGEKLFEFSKILLLYITLLINSLAHHFLVNPITKEYYLFTLLFFIFFYISYLYFKSTTKRLIITFILVFLLRVLFLFA